MSEFEKIKQIARAKFEELVKPNDFEATPISLHGSDGMSNTITIGLCYAIGPFRIACKDFQSDDPPAITLDGISIFSDSAADDTFCRGVWTRIVERNLLAASEGYAKRMRAALEKWEKDSRVTQKAAP